MIKNTFSTLCLLFVIFAPYSYAQTYQDDTQDSTRPKPEVYRESALRRAEIVFTISIPFTAIHSYFTVRGVEMIRQSKVSPKMQRYDWNLVAGLTVAFSGFIALWDWLHVRGEDVHSISPQSATETPLTEHWKSSIIKPEIQPIHDPVLVSLFMEF